MCGNDKLHGIQRRGDLVGNLLQVLLLLLHLVDLLQTSIHFYSSRNRQLHYAYVLLPFALVFVPFENGVQWFMIIKTDRLLWNKQEWRRLR